MTEHYGGNFDDAFEKLAAELASDAGVSEALINHAREALRPESEMEYDLEPITVLGDYLVESLSAFSRNIEVDLTQPLLEEDVLNELAQHMAHEMYAIGDALGPGTIVQASSALIMDISGASVGELAVDHIDDEQRIQGVVTGPYVGPIPNETAFIMDEDLNNSPVGVGLVLKYPIIADENGEHPLILDDQQVVLVLGTLGLSIQRLVPRSDH